MEQTWVSADATVKKDIIEQGELSRKPTECSICNITIDNVDVNPAECNDLQNKFHSEILCDEREKVVVIGETTSAVDRKIERAIQMMTQNEKSLITLLVTPEDSNEPVAIKFIMVLVKCELHEPIWKWTPEEKYSTALKYKEIGVCLFKAYRYVDAFHKFSKACKILITLEPMADLELPENLTKDINALRLILYNNMAGCHLNRNNFEHTIALCNKIIDKDKNNVKALYRRGLAHEPHNRLAKKHYNTYNAKLQEANQKYDDMLRRMIKI
ncbi:hypothetical protein KM043_010190 [Ampulex compressa]|nr:hypothetical protein KM043_010190 [Ampulex compressa]